MIRLRTGLIPLVAALVGVGCISSRLAESLPVDTPEPGSQAPPVKFKPAETPRHPRASDWPSNIRESLPMAGVFYGNHQSGGHTGNATIGVASSRRFRAERSGFVTALRYHNRILMDEEIPDRCTSSPGSVWCDCVEYHLDAYTCGYLLDNSSYSVGNGGSIVVELRTDDNGVPSSSVLASTGEPFVPLDEPNEFVQLAFEKPARLQAGRTYHLLYRNLNPPSRCGTGGVSVEQAASCPRDEGAHGLNGVYFPTHGGSGPRYGPFRGQSGANLFRATADASWQQDPDKLSWFELRYADRVWVGDTMVAHDATEFPALQTIGGDRVGRQSFIVKDATRHVDGFWLSYGHDANSDPDGSNLFVSVKDAAGRELASGELPPATGCPTRQSGGTMLTRACQDWFYSDLSQEVELVKGQRYSIELRAGSNAEFAVPTAFPGSYGWVGSRARGFWSDSRAEISTDGGVSWSPWAGAYHMDRDLGYVFTIVGMPKLLK